ncbi:MAG TPA: glycoside hydrolase family 2 protein [Aggregatilineaceae bacterium]|nr:glycoside hydrolase family 2 protein [Aggregatilineaceae bacterium]
MFNKISLSGEWELYRAGENQSIRAVVPGCVHLDLLRAKQIEDPFYDDNESDLLWIGETDWTYTRRFRVTAEFLQQPTILVRCHGLDTLAAVEINGIAVGKADNMFRVWEFDVKRLLQVGENTISVRFDAPMPYLRAKEAETGVLPGWVGNYRQNGGGWLRKEPCNFGWDWGPMVVTSGIWREIELIGFEARLTDVHIEQEHQANGQIRLNIHPQVETGGLGVRVEIAYGDTVVARAEQPVGHDVQVLIEQPKLWWVKGMGEQPLYEVTVQLVGENNQLLDEWQRRIGLRTLSLERHVDEWGESFHFAINGVPFFAKGANWIPADTFAPRLTRTDYEKLIRDAAAANMNMLRAWGGGIYEADDFYELCDEYGIAVWQDFIFACATYPAFDTEFLENVRAEAVDNIRRLRHHPCIALWCGNNELEQGLVGDQWTDQTMSWEDYDKLFNTLLPEVVQAVDPQRAYWPCSPHTSVGDRTNWMSPESGDAHLWGVWHARQPFEWYRSCFHRFVSEFGFQSFPEPSTINSMIKAEERNLTSYGMEYRQRSGIGNSTIVHYLLEWFRLPNSYESSIWLSQILQGMGVKYGVEHWRRQMPRVMGTVYWQINDCWPAPSWSSIDVDGRWKALHYMARRFYAPLLISGVENMEAGTVDIHVTSDKLDPCDGTVTWELISTTGEVIRKGQSGVAIGAQQDTMIQTLDLNVDIQRVGQRNLVVKLMLHVNGKVESENLVLFVRPKHLTLVKPGIQVRIDQQQAQIELSAEHPALWVWLSTPGGQAGFSDNFFHLFPGETKQISIEGETNLDAVVIQSLIDTYQ